MKYFPIFAIFFVILLFSSPAFGYTASKFASDYGEDLLDGQKIKVLVAVKGEPESNDPIKRAKEIRHLQSAVLKFCNFAGAINVKSDSWNNEFTAIVTTSLAKVLEERSDVMSVKIIETTQDESNYQDYEPVNTHRRIIHDLSFLDFEVLEVNKFFIPKWINEPGDYSDILQIKFNATNTGLDNLVIYKDMFQIDVVDPREQYREVRRTNQNNVVDNYYPQYIEDFKLRFQDIKLPHDLFDCELLQHSLKKNQTKMFSVCFDIKQKWSNQPLDLEGIRQYYLVMMDNKFTTSCPNCKVLLLNEYYETQKEEVIPKNVLMWITNLSKWYNAGIISETEFSNALNYLLKKGIINSIPDEFKIVSEIQNKTNLMLVKFRNSMFNEGSPIVFEGKLTGFHGESIHNATIWIKGDGPCPSDNIIAQGITDKHGRYKILTHAQLWDEKDGKIITHAEFLGTNNLAPSKSNPQIVIVYEVKGEKCEG